MSSRYLLDSGLIASRADQLLNSMEAYEFTGIAVEDLAAVGYANYRKNNYSSQETTTNNFQEVLGSLSEQESLLLESGYYYALEYGRLVYDAPDSSSKFDIADAEVPFYQMVLSGLKGYTGTAVNQSENRRQVLLKAIETGAWLHYELAEETESLQNTALEDLYSAKWELACRMIEEELKEFEPALEKVVGNTILKHEILQENVTRTYYENGWVVTVNYLNTPVEIDGQTVEAEGFRMERGEE